MELIERYVDIARSISTLIGIDPRDPALMRLLWGLLVVVAAALLAYCVLALILPSVSRGVRRAARWLSAGATPAALRSMERWSARWRRMLRLMAPVMVGSSHGGLRDRPLPVSTPRKVRWLFAALVRILVSSFSWLAELPLALLRLLWSGTGVILLIAAGVIALPLELIAAATWLRDGAVGLTNDPQLLSIVAAAAAVVAVSVVAVKLLLPERVDVRRTFQRERDLDFLRELDAASPVIAEFARAVDELVDTRRREADLQRALAEEWCDRRSEGHRARRWVPLGRADEHLVCDDSCLTSSAVGRPAAEYDGVLREAMRRLDEDAVLVALRSDRSRTIAARTLTRAAWEGYVSICLYPSGGTSPATTRVRGVPGVNELQVRRIVWQHEWLRRDPSGVEVDAARRELDDTWLAASTVDDAWDAAAISRTARQLGRFVANAHKRRLADRLARLTAD